MVVSDSHHVEKVTSGTYRKLQAASMSKWSGRLSEITSQQPGVKIEYVQVPQTSEGAHMRAEETLKKDCSSGVHSVLSSQTLSQGMSKLYSL